MTKQLESILAESPDFPQWLAESLLPDALEVFWKFYISGLNPEQVKSITEQFTPQKDDKEDV